MVDVLSLGAGLKAAYEIARSAKDVNDQTRLNTAISEIMEQLTSAQFGLFEMQHQHQRLLDENTELKNKLSKEERFEQYRLKETQQGGFVLELKEEYVDADNPKHNICPVCREDGRRSVMTKGHSYYNCSTCKYGAEHTEPEYTF